MISELYVAMVEGTELGLVAEPTLAVSQNSNWISYLPIASAIAILISALVSAAIFAYSQAYNRKMKRAETVKDLVDWFSSLKDSDAELKKVMDQISYDGFIFEFSNFDRYKAEPETNFPHGEFLDKSKEPGLASYLDKLNTLAFHVDIGLVKATDLTTTTSGYHFARALSNKGILGYLNHVAAHDRIDLDRAPRMSANGQRLPVSFYFLRKHGLTIAQSEAANKLFSNIILKK